MKQTILVSIYLLLLYGTTPKEYKIKDATAVKVSMALATVANYLDKSNMPHQDVRQLEDMLASADSALRADIRDSTLNKNIVNDKPTK